MTRIRGCAVLLVVLVAGLYAEQDEHSPTPRDLSVFAGKWELARGQHSTRFDGSLSILELTVEGGKLTGTITTGTRTVKVVGEARTKTTIAFRTETPIDLTAEAESFSGGFTDDELQGCYFRRRNGSWSLTGWSARRPSGH